MKYILFLSLLFISLGNLIIGKKASGINSFEQLEQFFPKIMYWLKHQEQKIDQTLAFDALSQIIKLKDQELQENDQNMKAINLIQQQVFCEKYFKQISDFCHLKMSFEQNVIDQEDTFINNEIKYTSTYFENKIKDKEKMIEQDIREIEKIKKQMKDHTKQQIKLIEIQELIKEIEISLQNGTADQLYKTLEIIESKAILGLFQSQKQYDEIDLYLKSVDQLFKTKNFQQDEFEIINLLSMIKNVLLDMKFDILIKIQEDDINYYETIQFFENSKSTHNFALDYFKTESKEFLGQLLKLWNKQLQDQQYNYDDISQFCQFIDNFILDIQKNDYQFKNDFIKLDQTTKKMENDFLKKNQNSQKQ